MDYEKKIKCVVAENGTIIPICNIALISPKNSSHYIWTNRDYEGVGGHKLSDTQYNALMEELKML